MMEILFIVIVIFGFVRLSSLSTAIKILKDEVKELKSGVPQRVSENSQSVSSVQSLNLISDTSTNPLVHTLYVNKTDQSEPATGDVFVAWFKENWLLKVGVLMILAGFGWFISYAFAHNWIGPVGRITLGFIAGGLITIFGTYRASKSEVQGNTFLVLGSSLIIITALAGQYFYNFFPSFIILSIIFLVSVYISFFAVVSSNQKLAMYGIAASLIAPYFSHTVVVDYFSLYLYLLIVSVAAIWVAGIKNWRQVLLIGVTGVLFYTLQNFLSDFNFGSLKYAVLFVVYLTSLAYLCVGVWSLIQNKIKADGIDAYMAIANTIVLLVFTMHIVPTVYQSLVIAGWMIVYAISGYFVFANTRNEKLFYIHALISVFLLGVATSIELSGPTLVIAFAVESAIITLASYVVTNNIKTAEKLGMITILPFILSLASITSSKWQTGIFHSDFAILAIMAIVYASLGVLFLSDKKEHPSDFKPYHLSYILATFYVYALIWLSFHSFFINSSDSAVFASLLVYTIIGLCTHFIGLFKQRVILKNYGMILLILVVVRLVLVDIWNMDLSLRVVTFVVLGILFVSTAFISKNQKGSVTSVPINPTP
jgi:uncharacterized membrane protein